MKKRFLIFFIAVLAGLCLSLAGCALFGRGNSGSGNQNSSSTDSTDSETEGPDSVRLDMFTKTLYVSDCSSDEVQFFEIRERYVSNSGVKQLTLAKVYARDLKIEDGYIVFDVHGLVTYSTFDLTVYYKELNAREVSKRFTFKPGGKIVYDTEHCSFNEETGLFSWTAVADAISYGIEARTGFNTYVRTTVTEPCFVADESVESFAVMPIFNVCKWGYFSERIYLSGAKVDAKYDANKHAFVWNYSSDSFTVEISENGNTVTHTTQNSSVPYEPLTDSVAVKITTRSALRRTGVNEMIFNVLPNVSDISLNAASRELSWGALEGATGYEVELEYANGSKETKEISQPSLVIDGKNYGATKAKILPTNRHSIAQYSDFEFFIVGSPSAIQPLLSRNGESGKLAVSFSPDTTNVEGYTIFLKADGAEDQVKNVATESGANVAVTMDLPIYQVSNLIISRKYKGGEGHYCFGVANADISDYSGWVLYAGAPEVVMKNKNASVAAGVGMRRAFTVEYKFPQEMSDKGAFDLDYKYADSNKETTKRLMADKELTFALLSGTRTLTVSYTSFRMYNSNAPVSLLADKFQTDVTRLDSVDISADATQIAWQGVSGAEGYRVEELNGNTYTEVYSNAATSYTHGVTEAGKHSYRVIPFSSAPFVMEGNSSACTIEKLASPTIALNADETISITSADAAATVVTLLDGEIKSLTHENILGVLTDKASATLVARCTRASTLTSVFIDSDDSEVYTLHRIADVTEESMALTVDAEQNTVTWAGIAHVNEFACRLFRKASPNGEYAIEREYTDDATIIYGDELRDGVYSLAVKPLGTSEGRDFYLYFGDFASSTFQKDGIRSVPVSEDFNGFDFNALVYDEGDYEVGWMLTLSMNSLSERAYFYYEMGESAYLSKDAQMIEFFNRYFSTHEFYYTFSVDYRGATDEQLSQNKTLKAGDYTKKVRRENSDTVNDYTGTHIRTTTKNGNEAYKVTLTLGENESLRPFEQYEIVYFEEGDSESTRLAGTEITIEDISGNRTFLHYFSLRVTSDKFYEENGNTFYYSSSGRSQSYLIAVQENFNYTINEWPTEYTNPEDPDPDKLSAVFMLGINYMNATDSFDLEYLNDNGVWKRRCTKRQLSSSSPSFIKLDIDSASDMVIAEGKEIQLRIRHCGKETKVNGVSRMCEDAAWQYFSFTALPLRAD